MTPNIRPVARPRVAMMTGRCRGVVFGRANRAAGFTLIEVLLATLLLAAGLALAFTTLRASTATVQRGEMMSQESERMRAVEGFLRRRVASALMLGFATDDSTGEQTRFIGEPDHIQFVADLPDYLGRGGPHLHDIRVVDDVGQQRLVVSFSAVVAGEVVQERQPRAPESLVPDLTAVHFQYRGLTADNQLGEWSGQWETPGQLPVQVSIEIESRVAGAWPRLVVALPQAGNAAGGLFQ